MNETAAPRRSGCGQTAVILLMVGWLGLAPVGATMLAEAVSGPAAAPGVRAAVALLLEAVLLLLPFVLVALVVRQRAGWGTAAATAAGLAAVSGILVLDGVLRATLAQEANLAAALRLLVLVPGVALCACLAPRLAAVPRRRLWSWLGLDRFDLPTLLLALALAALLTLPWPLSGSLGDSLTSLGLVFQTLVWAVLQVLLFWGLVSGLLHAAFPRPSGAALVVILTYGASISAGIVPGADWGALGDVFLLLPMAFLLTELRVRQGGVYPLLLVAFCARCAPLLFVDPRDAIALEGLPELQHVVSTLVVLGLMTLVGPLLWLGRRLLAALRDRLRVPGWAWAAAAALIALVLWVTWGGLYVFAGEPGFANDGFLIILEEQADLSTAYGIPDREARLQLVYDTLVETAERTQVDLRAELDDLGVPYRPYYIINMIRVDGHRWLMRRFEGRPGVAQVILNPNVRPYPWRLQFPYGEDSGPPAGVQANLSAIRADVAWSLGVTGEGIVVAGQDTGYDWTHPVLQPHYRGWDGQQGTHDYNWHDAWDDAPVPFDDDSHGTHTMGTVLGDDGGRNRTGVAPGAQWIACRNMRRGFGNPASYAECMEYFLAPYPHGGDPFVDGAVRMAPHVVNNSWGCPDIEGCFPDTLEAAVEALRAAGIMMVVSAGNEGPACSTVADPPANYDAAFSVAATTNGGTVVGFSSRGPVDGLVKPDVSAPGKNVRSSVPGGGYGWAGGTSMAGPHVAGVVALVWSANPDLVGDIDATEALICRTAQPRTVDDVCTTVDEEAAAEPLASVLSNPVCACGGVTGVPNNVYGCGFVDAGAAVRAALEVQ